MTESRIAAGHNRYIYYFCANVTQDLRVVVARKAVCYSTESFERMGKIMKVGIGQDSHRFDFDNKNKKFVLGGVVFEGVAPLDGNSDADVVLHALTNAISGVTCVNILGKVSDEMCLERGITDSREYVREALKYLVDVKVVHVSVSIECSTPKITPKIPEMRESIAELLGIPENSVGITATTGEGLTAFGQSKGVQAFCVVTAL
jgi:2-C-methyl-D-erythritol 2,4-cyclodiphosphate synthase